MSFYENLDRIERELQEIKKLFKVLLVLKGKQLGLSLKEIEEFLLVYNPIETEFAFTQEGEWTPSGEEGTAVEGKKEG